MEETAAANTGFFARAGAIFGGALSLCLGSAIVLVAVGVLYAVARSVWFMVTRWDAVSHGLWQFVVEHLVQLGGWAAAGAALCSVLVMARTNRSRAIEAVNNDFRDFMSWALENVNENDDASARLFAFSVIEQFSKNPPKELHERNKQLATTVFNDVTDQLVREDPPRRQGEGEAQ